MFQNCRLLINENSSVIRLCGMDSEILYLTFRQCTYFSQCVFNVILWGVRGDFVAMEMQQWVSFILLRCTCPCDQHEVFKLLPWKYNIALTCVLLYIVVDSHV
jgi:hypothetical protein